MKSSQNPILAFLALAVLCFTPAQAYGIPTSCFHPEEISCDFYRDCLERRYSCGKSGYPLGYGEKYCERFLTLNTAAAPFPERMSEPGILWRNAVLLCLQDDLVPILRRGKLLSNCQKVADFAFNSHPDCYTKSGNSFCDLPFSDWILIERVIDLSDLLNPQGIKQIGIVLSACALSVQAQLNQTQEQLNSIRGRFEFLDLSDLLERRTELLKKMEFISTHRAP